MLKLAIVEVMAEIRSANDKALDNSAVNFVNFAVIVLIRPFMQPVI